jgi:hypothetical protein
VTSFPVYTIVKNWTVSEDDSFLGSLGEQIQKFLFRNNGDRNHGCRQLMVKIRELEHGYKQPGGVINTACISQTSPHNGNEANQVKKKTSVSNSVDVDGGFFLHKHS